MSTPDPSTYVQLMFRHERDLLAYCCPLVGSVEDARDVVQQAALDLWTRFADYDPSRPYLPWALGFVRNAALMHCRRKRRYTFLTDELIAQLADQHEKGPTLADSRREALDACLEALPAGDRQLIERRYRDPAGSIQAMVSQTGQTANVLYKSLGRIRRQLENCVTRRLSMSTQ